MLECAVLIGVWPLPRFFERGFSLRSGSRIPRRHRTMTAAFKYLLFMTDCNNMFTAGFTVEYVSPCSYVKKMNKEVEGEEAGKRLNGSCEPRNKKNLQTGP